MNNKVLLIWNMVITIALAVILISGCSTLDPQYASTARQVKENRELIEQLVNLSNQNRASINTMNTEIMKNKLTIANLQTTMQVAIATSEASITQYVQTYVQQALQK